MYVAKRHHTAWKHRLKWCTFYVVYLDTVSQQFHLKLIQGLLSEADGKDKLEDGRELVQVKMVARCEVRKGAVEGAASTVV